MLLTAVLAFGVASAVTPLAVLGLRRWRVLDHPNERSSHVEPTPRGGGLGVALGVLLAVAVAPEISGPTRTAVLLAGLGFGLIGLLEDLVGVSALRRLPLLFVAAAAAAPWLLRDLRAPVAWSVVAIAAAVVWLVGYVNAFNFMDGINGLAAGQAVIAGGAWFLIGRNQHVGWLAAVGLAVAAAALGFAPHNVPRARVFLGDVGSYFLGGVLACAAVAAIRAGLPAEAVLAPLALFVADTGVTLVRRVARGERWYEAHREHAYQRLAVLLGGSHTRTTLLVVALMALCSALGSLSLVGSLTPRLVGDALIVAVVVGYVTAPALLAGDRRRTPALA